MQQCVSTLNAVGLENKPPNKKYICSFLKKTNKKYNAFYIS